MSLPTIPDKFLKFLIILSILAPSIEVNLSAPSFPSMARYFGVDGSIIQMTMTYNLCGIVIGCLFQGPLSDSYGRRKIMIIGNTLMLIGSVACVFANSIEFLFVARFLQGLGASSSMVISSAIVSDVYSDKEAAKFLGSLISILTICTASAPIFGSLINEYFSWRGNYIVVAVVAFVALLFLGLKLPETSSSLTKFSIKSLLSNYVSIFLNRKFLVAALIPSIGYGCYLSFLGVAAFLYKNNMASTTREYSICLSIIVISFSLVSMISGRIIDKIGEIYTVISGVILSLVGSCLILGLNVFNNHSYYLFTFCMMIFASGLSLSRSVPFAKSISCFPKMKGAASSAMIALRNFTSAILVSTLGYLGHDSVSALGIFLISFSSVMLILTLIFKSDFKLVFPA